MLSKTLRRADRALSEEDTRKVLARCQWGTLSYADDEGTLHSIPISYAVAGDNLYFHGGKAGTKWETLQKPRAATFVVATDVKADPEEFTTAFESVVLSGTVESNSSRAKMNDARDSSRCSRSTARRSLRKSGKTTSAEEAPTRVSGAFTSNA